IRHLEGLERGAAEVEAGQGLALAFPNPVAFAAGSLADERNPERNPAQRRDAVGAELAENRLRAQIFHEVGKSRSRVAPEVFRPRRRVGRTGRNFGLHDRVEAAVRQVLEGAERLGLIAVALASKVRCAVHVAVRHAEALHQPSKADTGLQLFLALDLDALATAR